MLNYSAVRRAIQVNGEVELPRHKNPKKRRFDEEMLWAIVGNSDTPTSFCRKDGKAYLVLSQDKALQAKLYSRRGWVPPRKQRSNFTEEGLRAIVSKYNRPVDLEMGDHSAQVILAKPKNRALRAKLYAERGWVAQPHRTPIKTTEAGFRAILAEYPTSKDFRKSDRSTYKLLASSARRAMHVKLYAERGWKVRAARPKKPKSVESEI